MDLGLAPVPLARPASRTAPPSAGGAEVRTTCCYCGVGCGIVVRRERDGRLSLRGDESHPANRGALCSKGKALLHVALDRDERLRFPQLRQRRGDPLRRVTWDAAMAHAAERFRRIQTEHGRDAVAFYVSGQCLTEEYYVANKLVKGFLGTNNIDTNSRLCMSSAVAGYKRTLGADAPPISYDDIEHADTFLVCGANPAWCHPILFRRIEARRAAHAAARLVVVDPRRTATAAVADLHLAIVPGTDVALHLALTRRLHEIGGIDRDFIVAHTAGWDALRAACDPWTLAAAAATCGVPEIDIAQAADWLAGDRRFLSLWTMGLNQSTSGVDKNTTLINLSLITGKIGRPGCGPFSLTGQPNAMGGREVGGLANLLPAHRDLADPAHRDEVARFWGSAPLSAKPGLTATEMVDALEDGRLKAIWIVCTNPVASLPDAARVERALAKAELVVVQDVVATETTAHADVLLPAATWLEKTGTMTNSERRITLLEPLLEPPGEALPDAEIIARFARALGHGYAFAHASPADVFREHAALTRGTDCDISGLDHARLRELRSACWPVPDTASTGTPRLYVDHRFATPDGRARLSAPAYAERGEPLDADFPLLLTTGRLRDQWHTMTKTGRVARLRDHAPAPAIDLHPDDAAARGIADGDVVEVAGRRGTVRVLARLTGELRPGVCFLPMHWGRRSGGERARTNDLTSRLLDPVSKEPDLKRAAVQVACFSPPGRRIVVVGAGAGALAFAEAMARHRPQDRVTIVGDEPGPIYDRVMLPHLIDGTAPWEKLVRADREGLAAQGVGFLPGRRVVAIDRERRVVRDQLGEEHAYDQLVLATGSRASVPADGPLVKPGAMALRTRADADAIAAAALVDGRPARVAIQGGGLLGIELADALRRIGCAVTILQRSNRLMGKQLDAAASAHLVEYLRDRGIDVRLDANLVSLSGAARVEGAVIDDGSVVPCELFVVATGTTPNVELARAAGLACGRGVIVDDHLRTSDPAVFAIGEVAEHRGKGHGTTAAAREQGGALAEFLRGNEHAPYRGSPQGNVLKVHGLALASCGQVEADGDPEVETVLLDDPRRRIYHKALVRRDRLIGVIMLGDTTGFGRHRDLIAAGTELEELRDRLLRLGDGSAGAPRGRLVCSCYQVGEDDLREAVAAGAKDVATLCSRTRAGTSCGSCRPEVAGLLATCSRATATATTAPAPATVPESP